MIACAEARLVPKSTTRSLRRHWYARAQVRKPRYIALYVKGSGGQARQGAERCSRGSERADAFSPCFGSARPAGLTTRGAGECSRHVEGPPLVLQAARVQPAPETLASFVWIDATLRALKTLQAYLRDGPTGTKRVTMPSRCQWPSDIAQPGLHRPTMREHQAG